MVPGKDDPQPEDPRPEDGPVLSPEELDISDDDHVEELDEGRYVVSPDVRTEPVTEDNEPAEPETTSVNDAAPQQPSLTDASVHQWLETSMGQANSRYGFDVTAKFGGAVDRHQIVSNDIVTVFESLILWYARQIDSSTPIEQVLGILLSESNVPVRYPPESLESLVRSTALSEEDSIGELLAAVEGEDGVQL